MSTETSEKQDKDLTNGATTERTGESTGISNHGTPPQEGEALPDVEAEAEAEAEAEQETAAPENEAGETGSGLAKMLNGIHPEKKRELWSKIVGFVNQKINPETGIFLVMSELESLIKNNET